MEHVNSEAATGPFYACGNAFDGWHVRQAKPSRVVAVIPHDINGLPGREGSKWATRIARGLCYDTAGLQRAHRAGRAGFAAGLMVGLLVMLVVIGYFQMRPASQCVDVGPYTVVPNG
jgi:hypothetical protein